MSTDATGAEILNGMAVFQLKNETKWFQEKKHYVKGYAPGGSYYLNVL